MQEPTTAAEQVVCVPREAYLDALPRVIPGCDRGGRWFLPMSDADNILLTMLEASEVKDRCKGLEQDTTYKQLATYCLVCRGRAVFVYRRGKAGGEGRLTARVSLGVGGHVNPYQDVSLPDPTLLLSNACREVDEELRPVGCPPDFTVYRQIPRLVGLVNDETDHVGQVHLGLVYVARIDLRDSVILRPSEDIEPLWWQSPAWVESVDNPWEGWSEVLRPYARQLILHA